jgi:hypothetical protein
MMTILAMLFVLAAAPVENQQAISIPAPFGELSRLDQQTWKEQCAKMNAALAVLYEAARDSTIFDMGKITGPKQLQLASDVQRQAWTEETRKFNEVVKTALEAIRTKELSEAPARLTPPSLLMEMSAFDQRVWKQQISKINEAIAFFYERVRGL